MYVTAFYLMNECDVQLKKKRRERWWRRRRRM